MWHDPVSFPLPGCVRGIPPELSRAQTHLLAGRGRDRAPPLQRLRQRPSPATVGQTTDLMHMRIYTACGARCTPRRTFGIDDASTLHRY